jgi:hypothetical protein
VLLGGERGKSAERGSLAEKRKKSERREKSRSPSALFFALLLRLSLTTLLSLSIPRSSSFAHPPNSASSSLFTFSITLLN